MTDLTPAIPVEVIFNPNWWNRNYGISFDWPFYLDRETRIQNDLKMRRALFERFHLGEPEPKPRPVIGSLHVAGGFVIPALLGVEIRFGANAAPTPIPLNLSREQILALRVPDLRKTWPMDVLAADMEALQSEYGGVIGDFDTDGILNTAIHLRGMRLWTDFARDPELVRVLFTTIADTMSAVIRFVKDHTGTCAIATNRSILNVNPHIYLHSNCSVQMIAPATYEEFLLPFERALAEQFQPYGIHHCGEKLERYAQAYAKVPLEFLDVGWGSDVARVREIFPQTFLNLRLSPMDMLWKPADEIRAITTHLLSEGFVPGKTGICCINMDAGTPDANVLAMIEAAQQFTEAHYAETYETH